MTMTPSPAIRSIWRGRAPTRVRRRPVLADPARLLGFSAAVVIVIAGFLPYAIITGPTIGTMRFDAGSVANGPVMLMLAAALAFVISNRGAAESRLQTLRFLPLGLAVVGAMAWFEVARTSVSAVGYWSMGDSTGGVAWTVWAAGGAELLAVAATAWLAHPGWRRRGIVPAPQDALRIERRSVIVAVAGTLGCVAGAVGGLALSVGLLPSIFLISHVLAFLFGGSFGAWFGASVGRRLALR